LESRDVSTPLDMTLVFIRLHSQLKVESQHFDRG
jgi:hypothetical protein